MKTVKKNTQAASALKALKSKVKPPLTKRTTEKQVKNVKAQKNSEKNLGKRAKTIRTTNSPKTGSIQKQVVKTIVKINGACSTRADVKNSKRATRFKTTSSPSTIVKKMVKNIINAKSLKPSPSKNVKKEVKDLINAKSLKIAMPLSKNVNINLKGNSDINKRTKSVDVSRSPSSRLKTSPKVPSSATGTCKAKAKNTQSTSSSMPRDLSGTGNSGSSSAKEKSIRSSLRGKEKFSGSSNKEKSGSNAKEKITSLSGKEEKSGSNAKEKISSLSGKEEKSGANAKEKITSLSGKEEKSGANAKEKITSLSGKEEKSGSNAKEKITSLRDKEKKSGANAKEKITSLSGKEKKSGSNAKEKITSLSCKEEKSGSNAKEKITSLSCKEEKSGSNAKEKITSLSCKEEKSGYNAKDNITSLSGKEEKSGANSKEKITSLSGKKKKYDSSIKEKISSSGTSSKERSTRSGSSGKEIMTGSDASGKEKSVDSSSREKSSTGSSSGTKRSTGSDPSLSSSPTVSEPDLSNIKTSCLMCNSTVRGMDIVNHLFFNILRCRECVSKVSTCSQFAVIENISVGCAMNKDEPHAYVDWQDPLMHLSYTFRKNISIDNYCRGINSAPTMQQITDQIKEYMTPLFILRELDPWKHAFNLFLEHTPVDPKSLPPPLRSASRKKQQDSQPKGKQDWRTPLQQEQQQPTQLGVMKEVTPSNKVTQRCDMQGQDHPSTSIVPNPVIKDTSTQKANNEKVCSLGVHNQKTSDIARFNKQQSLKNTESNSQVPKLLDTSSALHQKDLDVSAVRMKAEKDVPSQNAKETTAVSQPSQKANLPSKLLKDCKKKDNLASKTSSQQSSVEGNITRITTKRVITPSKRYQHSIKILKVQNNETPTKETEVSNVRNAKENVVVTQNIIGDKKNEKQPKQTIKLDNSRGTACNKSTTSSINKEITSSKSGSKEVSLGRGGVKSSNSSDESQISGKVKPEDAVEKSNSKGSASVGHDTSNTTDIRPDTKNNDGTRELCMNFEAESTLQENIDTMNDNNISKNNQLTMSKRSDTLLETSQIDFAINSHVKQTQPVPVKRKLNEESPLSPPKKKAKNSEISSILPKLTSITIVPVRCKEVPDSPTVQTTTKSQMKTPPESPMITPKSPMKTPPESPMMITKSPVKTPPESPMITPKCPIKTPPESPMMITKSPMKTPTKSPMITPKSPMKTPPESPMMITKSPVKTPPESPMITPKCPIKTPPESPMKTPPESPIRTLIKTPPESPIRTPPGIPNRATTESPKISPENQMKSLESPIRTLQNQTRSPSVSPMKTSPDCIHITLTSSPTPSPVNSYSPLKKTPSPTKTLEANTKSPSRKDKQKGQKQWWYQQKSNKTRDRQTERGERDQTDDDQVKFDFVSLQDLKSGRFLVSGYVCPEECPECYCVLELSLVAFKLNLSTNVVNIRCPSCLLSIYIKKKHPIQ